MQRPNKVVLGLLGCALSQENLSFTLQEILAAAEAEAEKRRAAAAAARKEAAAERRRRPPAWPDSSRAA